MSILDEIKITTSALEVAGQFLIFTQLKDGATKVALAAGTADNHRTVRRRRVDRFHLELRDSGITVSQVRCARA